MNRTIKLYSTGRYFVEINGIRGLFVLDEFGNLIAVY